MVYFSHIFHTCVVTGRCVNKDLFTETMRGICAEDYGGLIIDNELMIHDDIMVTVFEYLPLVLYLSFCERQQIAKSKNVYSLYSFCVEI
jgi:hypothetical protein